MNTKSVWTWSAAIALTLASGVLHGHWTHRFGTPVDLAAASSKLDQVPLEFGPWKSAGPLPLDEEVLSVLQCAGYLHRNYVHETTGERVVVFVVVGPPGPISVHTPEVCYSARAYQVISPPATRKLAFQGGTGTFWSTTLKSHADAHSQLEVMYGWNDGSAWQSPNSPRFNFAGKPLLYKVQLAAQTAEGPGTVESSSCARFLQDFLPAIQKYLVADNDRH